MNRRRQGRSRGALERYAKMVKDRDRWKSMYNSYGKKLRNQIKNSKNNSKNEIRSVRSQIKKLTSQFYFNPLINPHSIKKIICYITR